MQISVAALSAYATEMQRIGQQAARYVREAIDQAPSGAGVTELRELAIQSVLDSIGMHGDLAQSLAAMLFDSVVDAEGIDADSPELYDDIIDYAMLEERVRFFARRLVESDRTGFAAQCASLADFYAWRCNRVSMVRNCERNGLRYARIPTSGNPCDWCSMLASRGFVYHSSDRAESGSHAHCQCVVVCGGPSTSIEGYDPSAWYDHWQSQVDDMAAERAELHGTTADFERREIMGHYEDAAYKAKERHGSYRYPRR